MIHSPQFYNLLYNTFLFLPTLSAPVSMLGVFLRDFLHFRAIDRNKTILAKDVLPDLFSKINHLRDDILIYFDENEGGEAHGNHFGLRPFISYSEKEVLQRNSGLNFMYKHEISHIYHNDLFNSGLINIIASAVSSYVIYRLQFILPGWTKPILFFIPYIVLFKVLIIALRIFESRADDFAIQHALDQELIGARYEFQANHESKEEITTRVNTILSKVKKSFLFFFTYTNKLILPHDHTHLPLLKRVKKIEAEMIRRNMNLPSIDQDPANVQEKEKLKKYYLEKLLNFVKESVKKAGYDPLIADQI